MRIVATVPPASPALSKLLAKLEIPDCGCPRIPVLCRHKHRLSWHTFNPGQVALAHALFDQMKADRFKAFTRDEDGTRDEIKEFDAQAGEIIFYPDPPCDCPEHIPPCRHILEAAQHQLSPVEWTALLKAEFPRHYDHARPQDRLSHSIRIEARVADLIRRRRTGLSLWNDDDWWKHLPDDLGKTGATRDGKRLLNGADDKNQALKASKPSCQPPPPRERA